MSSLSGRAYRRKGAGYVPTHCRAEVWQRISHKAYFIHCHIGDSHLRRNGLSSQRQAVVVGHMYSRRYLRMAHHICWHRLPQKDTEKHHLGAVPDNSAVGAVGQVHRLAWLVTGLRSSVCLRVCNSVHFHNRKGAENEVGRVYPLPYHRRILRASAADMFVCGTG